MTTAKFLRKPDGFRGDARLYELDTPATYTTYEDTWVDHEFTHVIVSGVDVFGQGEETYIFPADDEGNIMNWGELNGSFKGSIDHERALKGAGWEVE